ncbi:MAG: GxxExxY protein [Armatimonadota bacterium]|nr:GxxExxY protein [Armatimonadota bacterium]
MTFSKQDDPLTYKIIGCCQAVHRGLGPGFEEVIYQRALALELQAAGLDFAREAWITVHYRNMEAGKKRVDFVVSDCLVELKARDKLEPVHFVQTLSYVKASGCRVGLLVNFGGKSLEVERVVGRGGED